MLQLLCLAILVICAGVVGCRTEETELPFETIDIGSPHFTRRLWWGAREPGLMVVADTEDLVQLDHLITVERGLPQLSEVDFDTYFVVAIFLGRQPFTHEGITLDRAVHKGDVVSLYTRVGRTTGKDMATSPYNLVRVRKEGSWDRRIEFKLYLEGEYSTSLAHFIP